ncbi:MAG: oxidoreductase [Flavihumibacter sp.]
MKQHRRLYFVCAFLLVVYNSVYAQQLDSITGKPGISFRGLSVVNHRLFWVSGTKGTVGRSTDGGRHIQWLPVKGYENRDFRDIEAFDAVTAVIVAIDSPGLILRTHDGGASWQEVYRDNHSGVFMDAFSFRKNSEGICIGDPIDGKFYLVNTHNGGRTWQRIDPPLPAPDSGEACFASSGTNIVQLKKGRFAFVTGGRTSRVWNGGEMLPLALMQGGTSTGANSLAVFGKRWIVTGGDFARDTVAAEHILVSHDRGRSWSPPARATDGFRSGITAISKRKWIACGTSGVDVSADGGKTWKNISRTGYHVVQRAKRAGQFTWPAEMVAWRS